MIQDGITFNSVKTVGVPTSEWPFRLTGQQGPDEDGGIINAVDIDWNDAQWPNTTPSAPTIIQTTGDLISAIKYASTVWNAANDVALKH